MQLTILSPEQARQLLDYANEVEVWAGGLLEKSAQLKRFVESTGAVSTAPPRQPSTLSFEDRAEISAQARGRWLK